MKKITVFDLRCISAFCATSNFNSFHTKHKPHRAINPIIACNLQQPFTIIHKLMMPNNYITFLACLAACAITDTAAFSHRSSISIRQQLRPSTKAGVGKKMDATSTTTTSLLASSAAPQNDERSDNNPSTKFGSPLR